MTVKVQITREIHSLVERHRGSWGLVTEREYPGVPSPGDQVELSPDLGSAEVGSVSWLADGTVGVELRIDLVEDLSVLFDINDLTGPSGTWRWDDGEGPFQRESTVQ